MEMLTTGIFFISNNIQISCQSNSVCLPPINWPAGADIFAARLEYYMQHNDTFENQPVCLKITSMNMSC